MANPPCIWLTRPQADSERLAERLKPHGIECVIAPVLEAQVIPDPPPFPAQTDAVLFTSRYAVYALHDIPSHYLTRPTFCVGTATEKAAASRGFNVVAVGTSGIPSLLPELRQKLVAGNVLDYPCGEDTQHDLQTLLQPHRVQVIPRILYRMEPINHLPETVRARASALTGCVVYSSRSAQAVQRVLETHALPDLSIFCLSANIATQFSWPPRHCFISTHPTQEAMVDLILSTLV